MADYSAGTAYLQIVPTLVGDKQQIQRDLDGATSGLSAKPKIEPEVDSAAVARAQAKVRELAAAVEKADADQSAAAKALAASESALETLRARAATGTTPEVEAAEHRLEQARISAKLATDRLSNSEALAQLSEKAQADRRDAAAKATAELTAAEQELTSAKARAVVSDEDMSKAESRVTEATTAVNTAQRESAKLHADLTRAETMLTDAHTRASRAIADEGEEQKKLHTIMGDVVTKMHETYSASQIDALGWNYHALSIAKFSGIALAGVGAVGALGGAVGLLPGFILGMAGPIAAISLGMDGMKKAAQQLTPQVTALKTSLSNTFDKGMTPVFNQLKAVFPVLQTGLNQVATSVVGVASALTKTITAVPSLNMLSGIFANISQFVTHMTPFLQQMLITFLQLAQAAGPGLLILADGLGTMASNLERTIAGLQLTGQVTGAISQLASVLSAVLQIIPPLIGGAIQLMNAIGPGLTGIVNVLVQAVTPLIGILRAAAPVIVDVGGALARILLTALQALEPIISALAPIFEQFVDAIGGPLNNALKALGPPLAQVATALGTTLAPLMPPLAAAFASLVPPLSQFAGTVANVLVGAFKALQPVLSAAIQLISTMSPNLSFLSSIAQLFGSVIQICAPFLVQLVNAFAQLQVAVQAASPQLVGAVQTLVNGLAPVLPIVVGALTQFLGIVTSLVGPVATFAGWLANTLSPALPTLAIAFLSVWGAMKTWQGITAIKDGIVGSYTQIKDAATGAKDFLVAAPDKIRGAWSTLSNLGSSIGSGISTGLDVAKSAISGIGSMVSSAASGVRTFAAALRDSEVAAKLVSAAETVWTGIQWALDAAMDANPIGLIILAIAGLVAAVIYCYTHFQTFRDIVGAAWDGIKSAAMAVWNGFLKPIFDGISSAIQSVITHWRGIAEAIAFIFPPLGVLMLIAAAVYTYWDNITKAMGIAWRWLCNQVSEAYHAIVDPIIAEWNREWAEVQRAYQAVVNALGVAWAWFCDQCQQIYHAVIEPVVNYFKLVWRGLQIEFAQLMALCKQVWDDFCNGLAVIYHAVIEPVVNWFKARWAEVQAAFAIVAAALTQLWQNFCNQLSAFYHAVIEPVVNFFKAAWALAQQNFQTVCSALTDAWHTCTSAISSAYHAVIDPIVALWHEAWDGVRQMFDDVVAFIGNRWNDLMNFTKGPINFVIGTVYDNGIAKFWNGIADTFGLGRLPNVATLASGGPIPVGDAMGLTSGPMAVVGEGNSAFPEYVIPTDPKYRDRSMGLLASAAGDLGMDTPLGMAKVVPLASSGESMPAMMASGGALTDIGSAIGSAWDWVKNSAIDIGSFLTRLFTDPAGAVTSLFSPVSQESAAIPGSSGGNLGGGSGMGTYTTALKDATPKTIGAIIEKAKAWVAQLMAGGGGGMAATSGQVLAWIEAALAVLRYPASYTAGIAHQIHTESGGNPGAIQGNIGDVNNASGDLAKGIMQVISTTFASNALPGHSNIFNPVDNIIAGSHYAMGKYGAGWFADGPWHNHGYEVGGILGLSPKAFDSGGYLPTGLSMTYNGTGSPEPVLTGPQWNSMAGSNGNAGATINVYPRESQSEEAVAAMVDRRLAFEARL